VEDGSPAAAVAKLRQNFAAAALVEDQPAVQPLLRQVCEFLEGRREAKDIALDLLGTPFQKHVWKTMLRVPRGTTWSYSELARRAGRPKAVRAVASACARNLVGLIVPCHRIVRLDGTLGGYGGGEACKRALLRLEQADV
jgi:O-6-methylguanine DNA methyltransferase